MEWGADPCYSRGKSYECDPGGAGLNHDEQIRELEQRVRSLETALERIERNRANSLGTTVRQILTGFLIGSGMIVGAIVVFILLRATQ
jgi:hypothetical protein